MRCNLAVDCGRRGQSVGLVRVEILLFVAVALVWVYILWGRVRLRARRDARSVKIDAPGSTEDDDPTPSVSLTPSIWPRRLISSSSTPRAFSWA